VMRVSLGVSRSGVVGHWDTDGALAHPPGANRPTRSSWVSEGMPPWGHDHACRAGTDAGRTDRCRDRLYRPTLADRGLERPGKPHVICDLCVSEVVRI